MCGKAGRVRCCASRWRVGCARPASLCPKTKTDTARARCPACSSRLSAAAAAANAAAASFAALTARLDYLDARDIEKARETGVHIHFQHVSTAISFDAIRKAKAEGLPITCETAPHYIALNDEALLKYGTLAKMNPPLRSEADRQATIAAVADGTVDLLATDHAPHTMEEKELGFLDAPNGIIGLECAYGVCHKVLVDGGFISDERLIELMSTGPAELMGHDKTDITAVRVQPLMLLRSLVTRSVTPSRIQPVPALTSLSSL